MSAQSSSGTADSCPLCGGLGRVDDPIQAGGLLCTACDGTGDRRAADLLRAYRLGFQDGLEAMRDAMPQARESVGIERLCQLIDQDRRESYGDTEAADGA